MPPKNLDVLLGLSGSDSDSDSEGNEKKSSGAEETVEGKGAKRKNPETNEASGDEGEGKRPTSKQPEKKKKAGEVNFEDLQRVGYTSGPSVKYMRAPTDDVNNNWAWGGGSGRPDDDEDAQKRAFNRDAANQGAEREAAYALKVRQQAEKLKQEKFEELAEIKAKRYAK